MPAQPIIQQPKFRTTFWMGWPPGGNHRKIENFGFAIGDCKPYYLIQWAGYNLVRNSASCRPRHSLGKSLGSLVIVWGGGFSKLNILIAWHVGARRRSRKRITYHLTIAK